MDISTFEKLPHQAAGHPGTLHNEDGSLFAKLTTQQEIDFYNSLQLEHDEEENDEEEERDIGTKFKDWVPRYIGVLEPGITKELEATGQVDDELKSKASAVQEKDKGKKYIILENLLNGFSKPSILDIKLGSKLYDDSADESKKQRMIKVSKETTSGSLHFRVCGMKIIPRTTTGAKVNWSSDMVSDKDGNGYISLNKLYGRSLNVDTVKLAFENFFRNNDLSDEIQQELLAMFHIRLQLIYNCLIDTKVELISSSLFFIFENDENKWGNLQDQIIHQYLIAEDEEHGLQDDEEEEDDDDEDEDGRIEKLSSLNVIDFAHAKKSDTIDENVIQGVENIIAVLEEMIDN